MVAPVPEPPLDLRHDKEYFARQFTECLK